MRRDRVRIKFAVPLVVFGVIGFAVIVAIQMLHGRTVVERFLSEATSLQLRVAGMGEVQGLAARYRDHVTTACDSEGCAYTFGFDNGWLRRLRLAPYTRLTCTLGVSGGLLVHRRLVMISGNNSGPFGAFVEEWLSYPRGLEMLVKPFDARRQPAGTRADIRWRIHVFLLADATPDQHRIAYDLNAACLSKIGGCEDARQLLPSVDWNTLPEVLIDQSLPRVMSRRLSLNN